MKFPWFFKLIIYMTIHSQSQYSRLGSRRKWDTDYDFIIVGAGSAGCVVAARLTENLNVKVLLIEAGGVETVQSNMPGRQQYLYGSDMDWSYPSAPQNYAYFANINQTTRIARGKVFGGSSAINSMNYYRGNLKIYDLWENTYGAKGWSYNQVLPYFLKSENNLDLKLVSESNGTHRSGGPLTVSTVKPDLTLERFVKAANIMGHPVTDSDGKNQYGVTIMQINTKHGIRQSMATAFLAPNVGRTNLHILGNALATKILFDDNKKTIGIQFYRNNNYYTVRALKEVILSTGVIGSPKLLMLSGIGPKEHLDQLNIEVLSDLRVGDNFHAPIGATLHFDIKNQSEIQESTLNWQNRYYYFIDGSGPLAYIGSGFMCFNSSLDWMPNIPNGCIITRTQRLGNNLENLVSYKKLKPEWREYYAPYLSRAYFILILQLQLPKSVGTVRLASVNPFDSPIIDAKLFENQFDVDILADTIKSALKIFQSDYFSQFVEIFDKPIPGCDYCEEPNKFCDTYLRCVVQTNTGSPFPVGTCKMGSVTDPTAVVDERLRVKGVSGLRVIDSSVIPLTTPQTNAATVMIGERGSDFIKEEGVY